MLLDLPHTQSPSKQVLILVGICDVFNHSEVHLSELQAFDVAILTCTGNEQNQRLPGCTTSPIRMGTAPYTRQLLLLLSGYHGSYLAQNYVCLC